MKKLMILIMLICILMGCESVITGPDEPNEQVEVIVSAEMIILDWSQIYNATLDRYENVEVIYEIENTGNVDIVNYELFWIFIEEKDGFPQCWDKNINYIETIKIGETKTDTMDTGLIRHENPVTEVRCEIQEIVCDSTSVE